MMVILSQGAREQLERHIEGLEASERDLKRQLEERDAIVSELKNKMGEANSEFHKQVGAIMVVGLCECMTLLKIACVAWQLPVCAAAFSISPPLTTLHRPHRIAGAISSAAHRPAGGAVSGDTERDTGAVASAH